MESMPRTLPRTWKFVKDGRRPTAWRPERSNTIVLDREEESFSLLRPGQWWHSRASPLRDDFGSSGLHPKPRPHVSVSSAHDLPDNSAGRFFFFKFGAFVRTVGLGHCHYVAVISPCPNIRAEGRCNLFCTDIYYFGNPAEWNCCPHRSHRFACAFACTSRTHS
jgi:hypothetical protein